MESGRTGHLLGIHSSWHGALFNNYDVGLGASSLFIVPRIYFDTQESFSMAHIFADSSTLKSTKSISIIEVSFDECLYQSYCGNCCNF